MPKKGHKVIQKDILGRLGRLFSTYAGREKDLYDNNSFKEEYIYKDSKNAVPSVPKSEGIEVYGESEISVPSVPTIQQPYWQRSDASCLACNGTESWTSIYGIKICSRCHPPASDRLVLQRCGNA